MLHSTRHIPYSKNGIASSRNRTRANEKSYAPSSFDLVGDFIREAGLKRVMKEKTNGARKMDVRISISIKTTGDVGSKDRGERFC